MVLDGFLVLKLWSKQYLILEKLIFSYEYLLLYDHLIQQLGLLNKYRVVSGNNLAKSLDKPLEFKIGEQVSKPEEFEELSQKEFSQINKVLDKSAKKIVENVLLPVWKIVFNKWQKTFLKKKNIKTEEIEVTY